MTRNLSAYQVQAMTVLALYRRGHRLHRSVFAYLANGQFPPEWDSAVEVELVRLADLGLLDRGAGEGSWTLTGRGQAFWAAKIRPRFEEHYRKRAGKAGQDTAVPALDLVALRTRGRREPVFFAQPVEGDRWFFWETLRAFKPTISLPGRPDGDETELPEILKVEQAAELLQVSAATVSRLIQNGELPAKEVQGRTSSGTKRRPTYRVLRESVTDYIRAGRPKAPASQPRRRQPKPEREHIT